MPVVYSLYREGFPVARQTYAANKAGIPGAQDTNGVSSPLMAATGTIITTSANDTAVNDSAISDTIETVPKARDTTRIKNDY